MQKRWVNKGVNLKAFVDWLTNYLYRLGFDLKIGSSTSEYVILASNSPQFQINDIVHITVVGEPNDFTVDLHRGSGKKRWLLSFPTLLSMFGGGILYLRELKARDAWIRFEKDFWKCVEDAVSCLSNSNIKFDSMYENVRNVSSVHEE